MNILFLCTGNSCRSVLAEATFNALAGPEWRAMSAGSHPTGTVHPRSLALLRREGISTEGLHSKSWIGLPSIPDIVITVCGNADQACPMFPGQVNRHHWGFEDPALSMGTDAEKVVVFRRVRDEMHRVFEAYAAGRLDELKRGR